MAVKERARKLQSEFTLRQESLYGYNYGRKWTYLAGNFYLMSATSQFVSHNILENICMQGVP